ncbi:hypothetical protein [Psittacicella gerlachiana]|uniref:Uncharacterized protein n=1 Tax=Psittacicella gerlachiana TaxID=2028574 RepID=A0A3A1YC56_9GAMM|nr:hypothetical protein [Psittacicella gerlachiana]RIY35131.1 hypothetical protein CKF59_04090 [Psittacicella gerlachiana]
MTKFAIDQIFSTFLFNVENPETPLFRLSNQQMRTPFDNHMFERVMLEREHAKQTTYTYIIYDTPDCVLLRNGLMVQVFEDKDIEKRIVKVLKFDYQDINKVPQLVDEFSVPITSRLDLHKLLYFEAYDLPFLTTLLAPRFPIIDKGNKILEIKPLLRFEANILDNSFTVDEANDFADSTPIELRHYSFEMLGKQDLFNSINNNSGFTLFENSIANNFQETPSKYDYLVPINTEMRPSYESEGWQEFLSDTFIAKEFKSYTLKERQSVTHSTYNYKSRYYDSAFARGKKFSYYLVHISSRQGNFYENYINLMLNLDFAVKFTPEPEHLHILNFLHLYNPTQDFDALDFKKEVEQRLDFTIYDIRDRALKIQEFLFKHFIYTHFAPLSYTKEMALELVEVLKTLTFILDRLMGSKSPEIRTAMNYDQIIKEVKMIISKLEYKLSITSNVHDLVIRRLLESPTLTTAILFLRHLYLERFGRNLEPLFTTKPKKNRG